MEDRSNLQPSERTRLLDSYPPDQLERRLTETPPPRAPSRLPYIRSQSSFPASTTPGIPVPSNERLRDIIDSTSIQQSYGYGHSYSGRSYGESDAILSRYKYYSRLAGDRFTMPIHVANIFLIKPPTAASVTQNSLVTILSLCNTMMGTSLLSIPWALNQAGFASGIVLLLSMGIIMYYTCHLILISAKDYKDKFKDDTMMDFSDICRHYLGKWAELSALVSALLSFVGGMVVYWILLSNFLYNIVIFIYFNLHEELSQTGRDDPVCPLMEQHNKTHNDISRNFTINTTFETFWDEQKTVPFYLIIILFPLMNVKSPTFFTKFNSLGTVSVVYMICFMMKNAVSWGIHLDFSNSGPYTATEFKSTFPALTGVAAFGYFVQNSLLSITRTQRHPENNERDVLLSYIIVIGVYLYMGVTVFSSFSLDKRCIEDNILNNLQETNIMAFVARIGLFLQITCVFPLLAYVFRVQFMSAVFKSKFLRYRQILLINIILIVICVIFAVFLPHIGHIIGLFGAVSGFVYGILLPCLVHMKIQQEKTGIHLWTKISHGFLILFGILNVIETCRIVYFYRIMYRKVGILTNKNVRDAAVDHDFHFFKVPKAPFLTPCMPLYFSIWDVNK